VRESQRASSAKVVLERVISAARSDIIRHTCMHSLRRASSDYDTQRRHPIVKTLYCVPQRVTSSTMRSGTEDQPNQRHLYADAFRASTSTRITQQHHRHANTSHGKKSRATPIPTARKQHRRRTDSSHMSRARMPRATSIKSEEWHDVSDDDGGAKAEGLDSDGEECMGGGGK